MRTALAAAGVVAVASLLAGVVLLIVARSILLDNINTAATERTNQVIAALKGGNDLTELLRPSARERTVVQVLDATGKVIAASDALAGQAVMSPLRPPAGKRATEQRRLAFAHDEPHRRRDRQHPGRRPDGAGQ
jgi:hypothetical protein